MTVELDASAVLVKEAGRLKEMLSYSVSPEGKWTFKVNFSSLSLMQECWRKVEYRLIRGLTPRLESSATLFGSAIHKALEVFYSAPRTQRRLPTNYKEAMKAIGAGAWKRGWEDFLVFAACRAFVLKAEPLAALPAEDKRSLHSGAYILTNYFERYLTDEYVILHDADGPIVERTLTYPIMKTDHLDINLFGTIDFVMQNEVTGEILAGDHKTTSSLRDFYDMAQPNFQYTAYILMAREVLGLNTDKFLVNALEVKAMPKRATTAGPNFARQITSRSEEDIQELINAVVLACVTFKANWEHRTWPMSSPGPCLNKYGKCSYHDVCATPHSLRENVIRANYEVKDV